MARGISRRERTLFCATLWRRRGRGQGSVKFGEPTRPDQSAVRASILRGGSTLRSSGGERESCWKKTFLSDRLLVEGGRDASTSHSHCGGVWFPASAGALHCDGMERRLRPSLSFNFDVGGGGIILPPLPLLLGLPGRNSAIYCERGCNHTSPMFVHSLATLHEEEVLYVVQWCHLEVG